MPDLRGLIARVKRRLIAEGLSQHAACLAAGINHSTFHNMMVAEKRGRGYPKIETLEALAPVLRTSTIWLMYELGPEVVMPDQDAVNRTNEARKKARRKDKIISIENVEGPVTVIEKVTIEGDGATLAGHLTPAPVSPDSQELMGQVTAAIDSLFREAHRDLPAEELGRLAAEHYAAIVQGCKSPEEYPHALEIMKIRVRKSLAPPSSEE